jgi:hypothetical protein
MNDSVDLRVDLIEAERLIFNLREDVRCSDAACDRLRAVIKLRNSQIADITKARDEAAVAYAERVRVLREALIEAEKTCDEKRIITLIRVALEATK